MRNCLNRLFGKIYLRCHLRWGARYCDDDKSIRVKERKNESTIFVNSLVLTNRKLDTRRSVSTWAKYDRDCDQVASAIL